MQSTFIDAIRHLQKFLTKLPGCSIVIQADSKLTSRFAAPTTNLQTLFHLIEYGISIIVYLLKYL